MKLFRVSLWATAGFLISAGWALYYASVFGTGSVNPLAEILARSTQPVAAVVSYFDLISTGVGVVQATVWNVATYALVGLIVETIRQRYRSLPAAN